MRGIARKKILYCAALLEDERSHSLYQDNSTLCQLLLPYIRYRKYSRIRRESANNKHWRQRRSFSSFCENMTERQFRRYFRMSRDCFSLLCDRIKGNVEEHVFRSEAYLDDLYRGRLIPHPEEGKYVQRMMTLAVAARAYQGDFISGEVKVALTLRLLAGGSYLDLSLIFETNPSYALAIFHQVIRDWILDDRLVKINGLEYCQDEARMNEVAVGFARGSGGVIGGCIGAIAGWIVKSI